MNSYLLEMQSAAIVLFVLLSCVHVGLLQQHAIPWAHQENQCGTVISDSLQLLIINGTSGKIGEVPWHAGIYTKTTRPYNQVCGGSLISKDIVISAAHCFWDRLKNQQEPPYKYAVAVGKRYRPWNDPMEQGQHSDVKDIYLPDRFQSSDLHYQDDIAIVIVQNQFKFKPYIRPVCVDFDVLLDSNHLQPGNKGKVAGWGLTAENGLSSQVLKTIELPYVDVKTCIAESPPIYRGYITSDKICAGYKDAGIALCQGDSGGGLAFPKSDNGLIRYYLRGIVSSAPPSDNTCNANFYTSFTWPQKHQHFVNQYWESQKDDCIFPPYPEHGAYVSNSPNVKPGDTSGSIAINVTCNAGYEVGGLNPVYCYNGWWPEKIPECVISTSDLANSRRTTISCSESQTTCHDGSCIALNQTCNGASDCPDGSDETHALCWNHQCPADTFKCTFGGCVNGSAPCNGIPECPDFSDELLPKCRNESDMSGQFKCIDGTLIEESRRCDGWRDCPDGSDETLWTCAGLVCSSNQFQCAYGACVDGNSKCNKVSECADSSDEAVELCEKSTNDLTKRNCFLPPHPIHGTYYITNNPSAKPGDAFEFVTINVTCRRGYKVDGPSSVYCYKGWWPEPMPKCTYKVSQCHLKPHRSVEYKCQGNGSNEYSRPCNSKEPSGTTVMPVCRSPNFYSPNPFLYMRCISGTWDYVATCLPECGIVAQTDTVPWHVSIYSKKKTPYKYICGGSLISESIVLSAAHRFGASDGSSIIYPAANFAVAAGKQYQAWNDKRDENTVQRSDVQKLHVPVRFQGERANYQDDIAVVILKTKIAYTVHVRPVCVDYDIRLDTWQLRSGNMGKMAGFNLPFEDEAPSSPALRITTRPYLSIVDCITNIPQDFREFITSDKICAGAQANTDTKTAICAANSGVGLAFPESERGGYRYYLRGVLSVSPVSESISCNESCCSQACSGRNNSSRSTGCASRKRFTYALRAWIIDTIKKQLSIKNSPRYSCPG